MEKSNIVLIGMPSSGKSTIGEILAKRLGMGLIDTDDVIRTRENKALGDIVKEDGLDKFLKAQESAVVGLDVDNHVISTGGSIVYSDASMRHLKQKGLVIFLKLEYEEIERRVSVQRRFARNEGQSLCDLYRERMPLYEKYADVTVDCSGKDIDEIVEEICRLAAK